MQTLQNVAMFLYRERLPIFMLIASLIGFIIVGKLIDIFLIIWLQYLSPEIGYSLPSISSWTKEYIAGYREFPILLMISAWLFLFMWFITISLFSKDHISFRIRFLYACATIWIIVIVFVLFIALSILFPFDILIAAMGNSKLEPIVLFLLLSQLIYIIILPITVLTWRRYCAKKACGLERKEKSN